MCVFLGDSSDYFDSLGNPPLEVKEFLTKQGNGFSYNTKRLQSHGSDVCGDYCILFAYFRCRGYALKEYVELFTDDLDYNDKLVQL